MKIYLKMSKLVEKILKEGFLNESKNVGILYHFTALDNTIKIFEENCLKPHMETTKTKYFYCCSLTRDKNLNKGGNPKEFNSRINAIKITLNGSKISEHYKIIPYNWVYQHRGGYTRKPFTESEEIVITDETGIKNIIKYITGITLMTKFDKENINVCKNIYELCRRNNIAFETSIKSDEIFLHFWEEKLTK